ncbi:hypothetical protein C8R45DRAFT_937299 [Mycena sanguinolenta]|nr:hypothetical protein C8R45DRAFT_937299 [Mycena sanguinolenta]
MALMLPKKEGHFPHSLHPPDTGSIPTASKALYGIYARIKCIIDGETKAAWCRMRLCTMHKSRMRLCCHNLYWIGILELTRDLGVWFECGCVVGWVSESVALGLPSSSKQLIFRACSQVQRITGSQAPVYTPMPMSTAYLWRMKRDLCEGKCSLWGTGTYATSDGSCQPTALELERHLQATAAEEQGWGRKRTPAAAELHWLTAGSTHGHAGGERTAALQITAYEGCCYSCPTDRYEGSLQLGKVARATKHYKVTPIAMEHSVEGTLHYSATVATTATDLYVEWRMGTAMGSGGGERGAVVQIVPLDFTSIIQGRVRPEYDRRPDDDYNHFASIMCYAERVRLVGTMGAPTPIPVSWWHLADVRFERLSQLTTHPDVAARLEPCLIRDTNDVLGDDEMIKTVLPVGIIRQNENSDVHNEVESGKLERVTGEAAGSEHVPFACEW